MKKLMLVVMILIFTSTIILTGKEVSKETASQVAKNWISYMNSRAGNDYREFNINQRIVNENLFIFGFENGGFVILPNDDDISPILGYSLNSSVSEGITNPALKSWLKSYQKIINYVAANKIKNVRSQKEWENIYERRMPALQKSSNVKDVPLLLTTIWDQGKYFNDMCPATSTGGSGGHVWAGCVATAMAQIMNYHNHPAEGLGGYSYVPEDHPEYGKQSAIFNNSTYNWASMPDTVSSSNNEIAKLLYHCGVSVAMNYTPDGSGASTTDAANSLITHFNYKPTLEYVSKDDSTCNWDSLLISELDKGQPMFYRGESVDGGHAFVCDGYQTGTPNYFHFNWGWSGYYNGFFMLDSLNPGSSNYSENQGAIIDIEPNTSDTLYQIYNSFENWALLGWRNINNNNDDDSLLYYSEIANPGYDFAHNGTMGLGIFTNSGADDWAVTNKIFLPNSDKVDIAKFSFWANSYNSSYLEDINVKLSITSNNVSDFTVTLDNIIGTPSTWTEYSYDLTSYAGDSIYIAVQSINSGYYLWLDDFILTVIDTSGSSSVVGNQLPNNFSLEQNYPNPFNPLTTIEYNIPQNNFVKITIYNLCGEKIKTLVNENKIAGNYSVVFDGSNFASGIYFYRIEAGNYSNTKKLVLMK